MTDTPIHTFPDRGAGEWVAYEDYAALKARAEIAGAAQAWQPIETAPKDGTKIILFWRCEWHDYGNPSDAPKITVGYWGAEYVFITAKEDYEWLTTSSNPYVDRCHATHWMPLPTPPTQ